MWTLPSKVGGRDNILTPIRTILAWSVVTSHFPQTFYRKPDFLNVNIPAFFIISGFCVFLSLQKRGVGGCITRRVKRLLPGLIGATLFSLLVGNLLTSIPTKEYWTDGNTWGFVAAQLTTLGFLNPSPDGIDIAFGLNAPTYTLKYEIGCYLLLCLGCWKLSKNKTAIAAGVVGMGALIWPAIQPKLAEIVPLLGKIPDYQLCFYFAVGVVAACFKDWITNPKWRIWKAIAGAIILQIAVDTPDGWDKPIQHWWSAAPIAIGICLVYLIGSHLAKEPSWWKKIGDPSYGIYLYHWPLGHALKHQFGLGGNELFLTTLFLSTLVGLASYHLIEKRFFN